VKNIYESFTHKMAAKAAGSEITSLSTYVKPVPDVDISFTFVTVYLSVFSLIFLLSTSFW